MAKHSLSLSPTPHKPLFNIFSFLSYGFLNLPPSTLPLIFLRLISVYLQPLTDSRPRLIVILYLLLFLPALSFTSAKAVISFSLTFLDLLCALLILQAIPLILPYSLNLPGFFFHIHPHPCFFFFILFLSCPSTIHTRYTSPLFLLSYGLTIHACSLPPSNRLTKSPTPSAFLLPANSIISIPFFLPKSLARHFSNSICLSFMGLWYVVCLSFCWSVDLRSYVIFLFSFLVYLSFFQSHVSGVFVKSQCPVYFLTYIFSHSFSPRLSLLAWPASPPPPSPLLPPPCYTFATVLFACLSAHPSV